MRTPLRIACVVALLSLCGPGRLNAQFGAFIDRIQKMSGPRFASMGLIYRLGYNPGQKLNTRDIRVLRNRLESDLEIGSAQYMTLYEQFLGIQNLLAPARPAAAPIPAAWDAQRFARTNSLITAVSTCLSRITAESLRMDEALAYDESGIDAIRAEHQQNSRQLDTLRLAPQSFNRWPEGLDSVSTRTCLLRDQLQQANGLRRDPGHGRLLRLGLFHRYDQDNVHRTDQNIYDATVQITVEQRFQIAPFDLGIESGGALHYYHGRAFPNFVGWSVPVVLNYHPFARCSSWLLRNLRLGVGARYFLPIDADAFAPIMTLEGDGGEWVFTYFVSLDVSRSSLKSAPRLECES